MSFDKRETLISTAQVLSNPYKRIYPFSVILNNLIENEPKPIKAPRPRTSRPVKADDLPNFMLEFLDQPVVTKKRPKSVIRDRKMNTNGFFTRNDAKESRQGMRSNTKRYASSTPTPSLNYRDFKTDERMYNSAKISQQEFKYYPSQRSGKVYNPYMIHITPRSRVTLYSSVPINLSTPRKTTFIRSQPQPQQESPNVQTVDYAKPEESGESFMETKSSSKYHAANTFGDKLLRLKELSINEIIIQHKY